MADPELIRQILIEGVASWNRARQQFFHSQQNYGSPYSFPDFSYLDFQQAVRDYIGPNETRPPSLAGIDLIQTQLSHANLSNVNLMKAELLEADLTEARLYKTILRGAQLQRVDFTRAELTGADLTGANLDQAILTDADLYEATLDRADLTTADLVGADLSATKPWRAELLPAEMISPPQYGSRLREIQSLNDLLDVTRRLDHFHNSRNSSLSFYFRGEPKCGWELKPSVMRDNFMASESDMLLELISRRPEEFSEASSSLAQWVLAQHHGLKTRFLDITKNPMVAMFHACERNPTYDKEDARLHIFAVLQTLIKAFDSDTVSVLANIAKLSKLNKDRLLGRDIGPRNYSYKPNNPYKLAMYRVWQFIQREKPYFQNRINIRDLFRVFVVEPQQLSERLRVQSGAFLVSGFHERFERNEIERRVANIPVYAHYALTIPHDRKCKILRDLQLINISRETLFPGLDESAKAITSLYESLPTGEDLEGAV